MPHQNPNLIPTVITDRNGKLTTVHRKPQALSRASLLPSPALQSVQDRAHLEKTTHAALVGRIAKWEYRSVQDRSDLRKTIERYSDEMLRSLSLICSQDTELAWGVAYHVMQGELEESVNKTVFFYRLTDSRNYWKTVSEVRALGHYAPVSLYNDLSKEDSYVTEQCLALLAVARLIDTAPENRSPYLEYVPTDNRCDMTLIRNDGLVNLIAQRPKDAEEIAGIILKYGTDDTSIIRGILEGNTPSLAEGTL